MLPVGGGGSGISQGNLNFTNKDLREWYAANSSHFLSDGVSFWWNDEGETDWFTYHWWNTAQGKEWEVAQPGERQFSLNRAFTPGMQRLGATVWSGDGQDCSHQMVLKFLDRGASYSTCDMRDDGDVSGTVLVRQYVEKRRGEEGRREEQHAVWCVVCVVWYCMLIQA